MFQIKKMEYGIKVRFCGSMNDNDMKDWWREMESSLLGMPGKYAAMLDFRACDYLGEKAKRSFDRYRKALYLKGMKRSVILFRERDMANGFRNAARRGGFDEWERYLSYEVMNCEQIALDWLLYAKDPELYSETIN